MLDARPRATPCRSRGRNAAPARISAVRWGVCCRASIPFRYFGAAVVYHVLAWVALLAGADGVPRFEGGLGWPLAALHLLTLGVLVMTAIGASLQLLPVATRQPLHSSRTASAIWWIYTPRSPRRRSAWASPHRACLRSAQRLWASRSRRTPSCLRGTCSARKACRASSRTAWSRGCRSAVLLVAALSLAFAYVGGRGLPRGVALALHVPFAGFGFLGMLALGLSYIVVPLFALSEAIDERIALASCALAVAGLCAAGVAAFMLPGTRGAWPASSPASPRWRFTWGSCGACFAAACGGILALRCISWSPGGCCSA